MDSRKIIVALYISGGMVVWFLMRQAVQVIYSMSYHVRQLPGIGLMREAVPVALGVACFVVLLWHPKINVWMDEVVSEIKKVTWPTKDMVYRSTTVVIILILVAGVFLAGFDLLWGKLIKFLLHS